MGRTSARGSVAGTCGLALALLAGCYAQSVVGDDAGDGWALRDGAESAQDAGTREAGAEPPDGAREGGAACLGGEARCGALCVDLLIDPAHCGACDRACGAAEDCVSGECAATCRAPRRRCGALCTDVSSDPLNCGACGRACGPDAPCLDARCGARCWPLTACGDACVDVATDPLNCGACASACAVGEVCRAGRCHSASEPAYAAAFDNGAASAWVSACSAPGGVGLLAGADNVSTQVPLPFPLRLWGRDVAAGAPVTVCSNGWISFDGSSVAAPDGTIPSAVAPHGVVAAHWFDLVLGTNGVCVATVGSAPNRRFLVEWNLAGYSAGGAVLTFGVAIDEGTNVITLLDRSMPGAHAATAGTSNFDGTDGVSLCAPGSSICPWHTGDRVVLTPVN